MVEESGVDVDNLLELLIAGAISEVAALRYYDLLSSRLCKEEDDGLFEVIQIAGMEDKNHYEALITRIDELGGKMPETSAVYCSLQNGCTDGIADIITVLQEAAARAMSGCNELCKITYNKDFRTYDLALAILHEKTEHEGWFAGILDGESAVRFLRQGITSPFVRKFLNGWD